MVEAEADGEFLCVPMEFLQILNASGLPLLAHLA